MLSCGPGEALEILDIHEYCSYQWCWRTTTTLYDYDLGSTVTFSRLLRALPAESEVAGASTHSEDRDATSAPLLPCPTQRPDRGRPERPTYTSVYSM